MCWMDNLGWTMDMDMDVYMVYVIGSHRVIGMKSSKPKFFSSSSRWCIIAGAMLTLSCWVDIRVVLQTRTR
jgi:hypothetical protein